MTNKAVMLMAFVVSATLSGCGGNSKLEQIEQGARDVERHAQTIEDEAKPN